MLETPVMNTVQSPQSSVAAPATGGTGDDAASLVFVPGPGQQLSLAAFHQLAGNLAGYPFVKVVFERATSRLHFLNNKRFPFHSDYIAEKLLGIPGAEVDARIDEYNQVFYHDAERPNLLGIVALHTQKDGGRFYTLETVEIDTMDEPMIRAFFQAVKAGLDAKLPILFKPASHYQEHLIRQIPPSEIPRVYNHEIFASARYIALNPGKAHGRLRAFRSEDEYRRALPTIQWHDIVVMHRVPDDLPRVAGIINAHHTTPLSHTNVLAAGWHVPNAIQLGIFQKIESEALNGQWVDFEVDAQQPEISLVKSERGADTASRPVWSINRVQMEEPEIAHIPIVSLDRLRMSDRHRYGTKAANLGELKHVLERGSERLTGFYRIKRPPRPNLLPYLAERLGYPETATPPELSRASLEFLRSKLQIPRGIAIPFSLQMEALGSSWRVQQTIGKLKMALELNATAQIDSLCIDLQNQIRHTRFSERLREKIDAQIAEHLGGVERFVVRSSSNAEDLENFSAAGIYESINHCTSSEAIFQAIKEVWASLVSPRSIRLRQEVGIPLDACYMGVIVQEEVPADMGGVMVTTNPMNRADFRNVYVNVSSHSAIDIVQGTEVPYQYLYNTVEGGGRTLSIGQGTEDLADAQKSALEDLALAGRLLQAHFSPDYTFAAPVDIEWVANSEGLFILQLRPFARA